VECWCCLFHFKTGQCNSLSLIDVYVVLGTLDIWEKAFRGHIWWCPCIFLQIDWESMVTDYVTLIMYYTNS